MKLFLMSTAVTALMAISSTAMAQSFAFEENGSASGEFELNFSESELTTVSNGSEYSFNGGAGSEGNFTAKAEDLTAAAGISAQYAGGEGNAYSNTNGVNYAEASYGSGSLSANGGLALSGSLVGNPAKVSYNGLAIAGGAGSATSGLTTGNAYEYNAAGSGSGKYKLKFDQTTTP